MSPLFRRSSPSPVRQTPTPKRRSRSGTPSTPTPESETQKRKKVDEEIICQEAIREVIHVSDEEDKKLGTVDDDVVLMSKYFQVKLVDLKTLEHNQWLNDTIINFYLSYLKEQVLPPDDKDRVYIFSTFFYTNLNSDKRHHEKVPDREKRHLAVARWTKSVNIFQKNLLVFPICTNNHWFLIVVVKPNLVACPDEKNNNGEPSIIVLDSLGGSQGTSVRLIREYLAEEWRTRMTPSCGNTIAFSDKQIKTIVPKKVIIFRCKILSLTFISV